MKLFRLSFLLTIICFLSLQTFAQFNRTNNKKSVPYRSNYQKIGTGNGHSIEIRDGFLWAWGDNNFGQLGDGSNTNRPSPTQIGSDNKWVSITSGYYHTIAQKSDGTIWSWGNNGNGQLGDGTTTNRTSPVQIGSDNKWVGLAGGSFHTVGIKSDGTLWAWGDNNFGQLGDGSNTNRPSPTQIGSDNKWINIAAGNHFTIATKSDGTLWAWGYNFNGQLGDGTTTDRNSPVQIGTDNKWVYISAGTFHTCGIKTDGTLWAWGFNGASELGDGTNTNRTSPVQIGTDNKWVSVSAGSQRTVGLKSNGTIWTWGLGYGTGAGSSNTPVQTGTDNKWVNILSGGGHLTALKSDGTIWGWGYNDSGQVGDGTFINRTTPVQISTPANSWLMISSGSLYSSGIKTDGTLWTWGINDNGQLGDGTTVQKTRPVQMGAGNNWISVAAGYNHMLAIRSDGTLWSWGKNANGQLGDGTTTNRTSPVQVGSDNKWVSIAGGGEYSAGLKSDGTIWTWGLNDQGQLGDGTTSTRTTPTQIGSDNNWVSLVVGGQHTIALKSNGTLWGWGYNGNGGLGVGNFANRYSPVQAGSDNNWSVLSAGTENTMAIKTNGTLWACGLNRTGQFGNGTINFNNPNFIQIGSDNTWIILSTGYDHTLGIKSNGTLWATGHNTLGSLGDGTNTDKSTFLQIGTENNWVATNVSRGFHSIGLKTTRDLFCGTGQNNYGQLGDGTTTNRNTYACNTNCPVLLTPSVSITATNTSICTGTSITFTATAVNGGSNPVYQWKKNGNNVGTNTTTYADASLANGDVINCVLTSNAACTSVSSATSNSITMVVTTVVTPSVSISASATTICAGSSVNFTATPTNGGALPLYQWKKNGNNVGTNSNAYSDVALQNGDVISCVMTSNFTCVTTATATSNSITMLVNALPPTPAISASGPTTFCQGGSVTLDGALPSGNTWAQKSDFGGPARYSAVGFSIGNKGYLGTGQDTYGVHKDFWEFDPSTNAWTQKADFGGTARSHAVGFSIGAKGYIGTGTDLLSGSRNDFWEFDPSTNAWTQKANYGGGNRIYSVGFSIGNKGYIGTGFEGTEKNDFWEYDPLTDQWIQKSNFVGTARMQAVGFSIGSKGYIGTGIDISVRKNDFWEFNPVTNSWLQLSDFAGSARHASTGFAINSKGFISGGQDNSGHKNDLWEYDRLSNSWIQKANFPGGLRYAPVGFSIDGTGYIGTGYTSPTARNDFWEYKPSSSYTYSWSSGQTTSSINVTQSGNYILTITGENGCTASSSPVTVTLSTPVATITASGPTTFCQGGTVTLTASAGSSYSWSNGANTQSITVSAAGSYSVTVTDANGCSAISATTVVTINAAPPTPVISASGPTTFCQGGSVTLNGALPSGNTWTQKADFGGSGRFESVCFSIGTKGYIGSGVKGASTYFDFWEYDPSTNIWTQKANFGGGSRTSAVGFSINNKGYIGTGWDGSSHRSDFWEYDPISNSWIQKANFGGGNRVYSVGFSIGNKGYLGTGFEGGEKNDFWEYDPVTDQWIQKSNFGGTARMLAIGFSIGSKGYIGTGSDLSGRKKDFWEFNPVTNSWLQLSDFAGSARYASTGFAINSKGYIGAGQDNSGNKNDLWEYDRLSDSWIQKANFPGGLRYAPVGFSIDGTGYIGTGFTSPTARNDFWEYKPSSSYTYSWSTGQTTSSINVTQSGNYILTITGENGCTASSSPVTVTLSTPEATITASGPTTICQGGTVTLTANSGSSYNWSNGANTQSITVSTAGSYTVTVSDANGCSAISATTVVTVNAAPPTPVITASGPTTFCQGGSVTLNGTVSSGNAWVSKTSVGGGVRMNAVAFSIGSKGYIGTGTSNGAYRKDFWQFDPASNTWTQKADFGGTARAYAVGFSMGTKGYVGTGLDATQSSSYRKDFWEYDPDNNTWNQKADFGGPERAFAVGFSIGNKGYIGTGQDMNYTNFNDFWQYDPQSNTWTQQADIGVAGRYFAIGFGIGSKGYIGTGVDDSQANLNDFWEFNPSANLWTQKANVGGPPRFLAVGFSNGSKGYVGTGIVDPGITYRNDFWEYDPAGNTWTQQVNFGGTPRESAVGFSIGARSYIGTGMDDNSGNLHDFWEFGPSGNFSYNWSNAQTGSSISVNQSGNYTVTVTGDNGCSVTSAPVSVTVHALPAVPVITASGSTSICQGSSVVLHSNVSVSNADQWIQRANFGGTTRYGAIAFAIGENCYIGSGIDNNYQYSNDFWEFNPTSNSWSQKSNIGSDSRSYAVGFSIGAKGYAGTGVTGSSSTTQDFWEYDPLSNSWTQKADFGGIARVGAIGFVIGSKGYIGLGYDDANNSLMDIWEFNPTQNQWIQKQDFPGLARKNATGLAIGSKGYVGLGYDDSYNFLQDFWEFDPSVNAWVQKNNFGGDARYSAVGFAIGNNGYVGTGIAAAGFVNDIWQFDPATNTWLQKANFTGGPRASGIAISTGTVAYIGTGINDGIFKNDFWQYQINAVGSSVLWSNGESTASINVSQPGNYSVTVTGATGCSATSVPVTVTLLANANAGTISGTSPLLEGNSAYFTSNGDTGGTWNSSHSSIASVNAASGLVSALTAGLSTISYTVTGCNGPSVANFSLTVSPAITAGTVTGPSPICAGNTGLFTSTGTPGGSWSSSNTLVASVHPTSGLVTALSGGTVTITYSVGSVSTSASLTVASGAAPVITGFTNVCPYVGNASQITYTATAIGATSFNWLLPPNVTLVSQTNNLGTGTITVTFANGFTTQANKQIRVTATSVCGTSPMTIYYLLAQNPGTAQPIVASNSNVCPSLGTNIPITYTIPKVLGASSYIWNAQSGTTTITHPNGLGANDTTVTVTFTGGFSTSNITVQAVNSCGTSGGRALTITRANPATPGLINGPTNVCANILPNGTVATYTVAQQPTTTSYTWTVPVGAFGLTGQGTNSISFTFPAGFTGGAISLTATNGCGTGAARSLAVSTLSPATPSVIDVIQTTACPNRVFTYSLASMPANATAVNWTYPSSGIVVSQTAFSITIAYPSTAITGTVTAQAVNNCGNSVIRSSSVFLPACPPEEKEEGNNTPVYTRGKIIVSDDLFEARLFPNPSVYDYKLIVKSCEKNSEVMARLLDIHGREIKRMILMPDRLISFGGELKAGIYFIEVWQGEKRNVMKLIKM